MQPSTFKGTLLIVDDIPDNVKILFKFLVDAGFKVLVAQDGAQGIRVTERVRPDLILLDIMMPGLNGFEVCRLLKSHEETKSIPIIFMTALVDTENKVKGFKLGAADYITKPFQQEEVLARVTTHLHLNQQQRQLQAQAELLQTQKQTLYQQNKQLHDEITIRKEIEMSLQQHATMLAERTMELQVRSIELKKRNMELDAFAHTVAHDLKNPLTVITGIADLLLQHCTTSKPPERKYIEGLHVMVQTSQKMYSIVESILLLAGISRKTELEIKPLDMSSILNQVLQRLSNLINEYQVKMSLPKKWPVAAGYAPWVEEIWFNYLSNGFKYGGRPPQLVLGAEKLTPPQDETNEVVRFWVRDNGAGLTSDEQARLFTPFTRLYQNRVEGHGLGLSIVKQIVEKLGGTVGVESSVGQGSLFYFTLPIPFLEGEENSVGNTLFNQESL